MRFRPVPSTVPFMAAAVPVLLIAAQELNAQDADISGTWVLEVQTEEDESTATVTLVQDGASLTGRYSSDAFGEREIAGTVEGSTFTFSFEAVVQRTASTVTYRGTVESRYRPELVSLVPFREVPLRRVGGPVSRDSNPLIYIDGVRIPVDRTEELSGTIDVGGFASGMFTAQREQP